LSVTPINENSWGSVSDTDEVFMSIALIANTGDAGTPGAQGPAGTISAPTCNNSTTFTSPLAWNSDNFDMYVASAQASALTINADSGTPAQGKRMVFRFKDDGTARALTWTTGSSKAFRAVGVTLPTTTTANKTVYVGCMYNIDDDRWDAIAVSTEA
jgi:hypothetical protein